LQEFKEDLGDRACEQFSRFESTEQIPDESWFGEIRSCM
jgi:hypothetical protein